MSRKDPYHEMAARLAGSPADPIPTGGSLDPGASLDDLWGSLPEGAEGTLLELDPDPRTGDKTTTIDEIGRVTYWIDACSEGADRGGYVQYVRLDDWTNSATGEPITLEAETDGSALYFDGRNGQL
jgi:hypothetical protein